MYIYISTWLCPSPPPLIKGWFDHMEAIHWSFPTHGPPRIIKMVTRLTPIQQQVMNNQCLGKFWCLLGGLQGPKRHQIPKSTKSEQRSVKWSILPDPN